MCAFFFQSVDVQNLILLSDAFAIAFSFVLILFQSLQRRCAPLSACLLLENTKLMSFNLKLNDFQCGRSDRIVSQQRMKLYKRRKAPKDTQQCHCERRILLVVVTKDPRKQCLPKNDSIQLKGEKRFTYHQSLIFHELFRVHRVHCKVEDPYRSVLLGLDIVVV